MDSAGNLYIADQGNNRIRKVSNGVITTVAGNGTTVGFLGDNGPATSAQLYFPDSVAVDSAGNLYIADAGNNRIRKVSNGVITTVAGNGMFGYSGDNGPAASAWLCWPQGVAVDSAGNVYIADQGNNCIRILTPTGSSCTYSVAPASLQAPAAGGNLTVSIQTGASCPWTVSGLPGWITVSGPTSGTGSATVTLVTSLSSGAPLSATILIAGVSVAITQPAAPLPTITTLMNAASFSNAAAASPGEIVSIGGAALGPATAATLTLDSTGKVATTIGGVTVTFNGYLAPLIYVSATQINAIVPYEVAGLILPFVQVKYLGQTSNGYTRRGTGNLHAERVRIGSGGDSEPGLHGERAEPSGGQRQHRSGLHDRRRADRPERRDGQGHHGEHQRSRPLDTRASAAGFGADRRPASAGAIRG